MEVRIAMLETKVDDLFDKIAEIRRDMATKADIANLQRQIDEVKAGLARLEGRIERLEERIGRLEDRLARLEQRIESEFKQLATKEEMRKDMLTMALGIISAQAVMTATLITAVLQILR